ncbi:hypothetical protein, partial [uncultured Mediterranea sp.]|uniref:hypothetical protein n=1 Tax=uncultured Mediterranea sp. TaxID=1926662 RepID=UPI002804086A
MICCSQRYDFIRFTPQIFTLSRPFRFRASAPLHLSLPPPAVPRFLTPSRSAASPLQEVLPQVLMKCFLTPS